MRNQKCIFVWVVFLMGILLFSSVYLQTPNAEAEEIYSVVGAWEVARAEADEDATTLDLTTEGDFSEVSIANGWFQIPAVSGRTRTNNVLIIASAGSAAAKTFDFRMLSAAAFNGPVEVVMTGQAETGTQPVVIDPTSKQAVTRFWVDNFNTIVSRWWSSPRSKDGGNNNFIDGIRFDGMGSGWYKIEVTSADGSTGTEAGDVKFFWRFV